MMRKQFSVLLLSFLLLPNLLDATVIVFDVGDVLFNVATSQKFSMARNELGLWDLIWHRIGERRDIKRVVFNFLTQEFGVQQPEAGCLAATQGENEVLPQIMCDWLANTSLNKSYDEHLSEEDCITKVLEAINTTPYLQSKRERKLAKKLVKAMFTPEKLAAYTQPIPEAAALLADLAAEKDDAGNSKHTFFILSNYSTGCFKALADKESSHEIFDYFDLENHAVISGDCHTIKPYKSIYMHLRKRLIDFDSKFADDNYLAENCVFIDDQISNILEGRKCGIKLSLWLSNGDYDKLRQELTDLAILTV